MSNHTLEEEYGAERFIVIRFAWGWVVWDRFKGRVADGIYTAEAMAREQAAFVNLHPELGDRDWFASTYWSAKTPKQEGE
ncbi:MAG TPA: hypothetical protein VF916_09965 [Ktedonobacterales bacterium]